MILTYARLGLTNQWKNYSRTIGYAQDGGRGGGDLPQNNCKKIPTMPETFVQSINASTGNWMISL